MKTVRAIFESGEAARAAVRQLHGAGFSSDDIAFVLRPATDDASPPSAWRGETAGRRLGELMADAAYDAAAIVPFVGRNLADSPVAEALRGALRSGVAAAGRVAGAIVEGGLGAGELSLAPGGAAVVLRTEDVRATLATSLLADAGAVAVESLR